MTWHRASQSYTSGEVVPQSGLYVAMHPGGAVSYAELRFDKGEAFPLCSRCDHVRYSLLHASRVPDDRSRRVPVL